MSGPLRALVPWGSILIFASVNAVAAGTLPAGDARPMLLLCAMVAVAVAVQSAIWDPDALMVALLLSLPPVIALIGSENATWMVGPLGALLLAASELNALGWEIRHRGGADVPARRRLIKVAQLAALGLLASVLVGAIAAGPTPGGTAGGVVAASALAALAWVMFGRGV